MKTKVVYVVVSNGKDTYLEQVYISLISLKEKSPEATSCLVVDSETNGVILRLKYKLLQLVDELIVVDVPKQYKGAQSSRYIKTSLREYISGPYLFIDTDTVISQSLSDIDDYVSKGINIACVKDAHLFFKDMPTFDYITRRAKMLGWNDLKNDNIHFNSGVMFVNDNDFTHDFYKKWHKNWLYEIDHGYYYDQLALARTNRDENFPIAEMPGFWNCQIFYGALLFFYDAKIIHYGGDIAKGRPYYFRNHDVFDELSSSGKISEFGMSCIRNPQRAFVGKTILIGDEYWDFFWSHLRIEYMFHKKRYRIWEGLARLIQNILLLLNKNKRY